MKNKKDRIYIFFVKMPKMMGINSIPTVNKFNWINSMEMIIE